MRLLLENLILRWQEWRRRAVERDTLQFVARFRAVERRKW